MLSSCVLAQPVVTPTSSLESTGAFIGLEKKLRMVLEAEAGVRNLASFNPTLAFAQHSSEAGESEMRVIEGDEGISFPSPTEVVLEPVPTLAPVATATASASPTPWVRPSRCEKNETVVEEISAQQDPQKVLYELIFLSEDLVPLDPEEVFGTSAALHPYGFTSGKKGDLQLQAHGVPCIPYRVRRTARDFRYDYGDNALKNYSKDQTGRGIFHPWINEKLFAAQKGVQRRPR